MIDCTYYRDGSRATVDQFIDTGTEAICWEGTHVVTGSLALLLLVLYVLSTSTTGITFQEDSDPTCDVRWQSKFILKDITLKTIILIPNVLDSS